MKIAVIGAGLMGRAAVYDLSRIVGVDSVGVFDIDSQLAIKVAEQYGNGRATAQALDAGNESAVESALRGYASAMSCVTYKYNPGITRSAIKAGCHLVDLGGNNDAVRTQLALDAEAARAGVIIVPDCGLAPGMVAVLAADAVSRLDVTSSLRIRVGGLPQNPRPPLNYQMVFSAEGLINEYWEPCVILKGGKQSTVDPMSAVESLSFEGLPELEAFYTSGGTSTLPDTYRGKIDFLDYKTIRYKGHCELFRPMLELGLASRHRLTVDGQSVEPRAVFKAVLDNNLSFGEPDLVLVRLTAEGTRSGSKHTITYEIVDRQDMATGLTAMMRTTAFPAVIVAWMAAAGKITARGSKPQELVVDPKLFFDELRRRKINLVITEG
jgi:lysine 6-dehydrogenase